MGLVVWHVHRCMCIVLKYHLNSRCQMNSSVCMYCTCMYCMNCFFIDNVVHLLFYVNMCACRVYFTINLLTYLTWVSWLRSDIWLLISLPLKTKGPRRHKETWWWNEEVAEAVRYKKIKYGKWKKENTEQARMEYKKSRQNAKRVFSSAKEKKQNNNNNDRLTAFDPGQPG